MRYLLLFSAACLGGIAWWWRTRETGVSRETLRFYEAADERKGFNPDGERWKWNGRIDW